MNGARQVSQSKQLVHFLSRWLRDEEAAGSNPATPTQVRRRLISTGLAHDRY